MFKLNIEKAKELHRNQIRAARVEVFQKLDAEFMKAFELGDAEKLEEIKQKKQELRDLTKCDHIECAECVEDLKHHWPNILECECPYGHLSNVELWLKLFGIFLKFAIKK